jgi:predicted nucleotidyltransferase
MVVLEKYTVDDIKELVKPLLKKYSANGAILFGSYARGEATEESDIDIVVLGGKDFDPTDVFCIADELYDLSGKDVDVYEEREIDKSSEFYKNILKDGIRI